ncbi:MAG: VCBS repeat-containing protein [Verrucomicrobia bacterium]|nr:VCBS repeat-containing protein [Verrucomicrobiota bacterium]MBI3870259.1 VCBS repeat-containing protein [Verrucomicrobiota bacterium]
MLLGEASAVHGAESCASVLLDEARSFPVGGNPRSVALGDFNGDGKMDLAVANLDRSNVSILIGVGDGTFRDAVNTPTLPHPRFVAAGDFNKDGKLDLAVANIDFNSVSILLGQGDGTFIRSATRIFDVDVHPVFIAVGDFNGDRCLDIAVANNGCAGCRIDGSVSILLGKGDGTFARAVDYPEGAHPVSLVVGDFNGDGAQDLAVANVLTVSVLLGRGDGTFTPGADYTTMLHPVSVASGDFNEDGKLDLAVANDTAGTVTLLRGQGDGSFLKSTSYKTGTLPVSVAVGDLNGDHHLDLVVADLGSEDIWILLGDGAGAFRPPVAEPVGAFPGFVLLDDVDGDTKPDVVVANENWDTVSVRLNTCPFAGVQLSIGFVAGKISLTWPHTSRFYEIETASSLNSPVVWQPIAQSPSLSQGQWQMLVAPVGPQGFFRLRRRSGD